MYKKLSVKTCEWILLRFLNDNQSQAYGYEIFLFWFTFLNVLNNVDYTITYMLPIPRSGSRIKARSEFLNASLVSPCVKGLYSLGCIDNWQLFSSTSHLL